MKKNNEIIEGPLFKEIIRYLTPLIFSMLIQQSYQTIDALIVGRYGGSNALGAIDSTYGFIKLLINSTISLTAAASVIIARNYGSRYFDKVKSLIKGMLYNTGASILRSIGNSKFPAVTLVLSCIINVTLDIIFIILFRYGVAGAAIATVFSQIISAILVSIELSHVLKMMPTPNKNSYNIFSSIKELLVFGMPAAIQSVLFSFSNIYLQAAINRCGSIVVSGWAVCGKLDFIIWIIADGLSITAATFVAQNLGAGKNERAKKSQHHIIAMYVFIMIIISGILYLFTPYLAAIFVKDSTVIEMSYTLMRLIAPFYVASIGAELFSGILRGLGKSKTPTVLTLVGTVGGRVLWLSICSALSMEDITFIIWAYPFSWILTTMLFICFGRKCLLSLTHVIL
jgi:Na+-driven multidrug efflux pump